MPKSAGRSGGDVRRVRAVEGVDAGGVVEVDGLDAVVDHGRLAVGRQAPGTGPTGCPCASKLSTLLGRPAVDRDDAAGRGLDVKRVGAGAAVERDEGDDAGARFGHAEDRGGGVGFVDRHGVGGVGEGRRLEVVAEDFRLARAGALEHGIQGLEGVDVLDDREVENDVLRRTGVDQQREIRAVGFAGGVRGGGRAVDEREVGAEAVHVTATDTRWRRGRS